MGKDLNGKELGPGIAQRKGGRYSGRFVNRFGKRVQLYDADLKELKRKMIAAQNDDFNEDNINDTGMLLDQWFFQWMNTYKVETGVIRNNTINHYTIVYKKHISPTLGRKAIKDIKQVHVQELIGRKKKDGYQWETRSKIKLLLLASLDVAITNGYLRKNPARGVIIGKRPESDPRILTRAEQSAFFECSKGTWYDNLFTTAVSTGLRPGELCALTEEDIDFVNMEVDVNKTLLYQKLEGDEGKRYHINPPKTETSRRRVPMTRQCATAIKKQIMQRKVLLSSGRKLMTGFEDLLFTSTLGTPINAQTYSDAIDRILDELNLMRGPLEKIDHFSGHCFRHCFATRCFENEIPIKTVQKYLGHKTRSMTEDLYTHVLNDVQHEHLEKLEANLDGYLDVTAEDVDSRFSQFAEELAVDQNEVQKVVNMFGRK